MNTFTLAERDLVALIKDLRAVRRCVAMTDRETNTLKRIEELFQRALDYRIATIEVVEITPGPLVNPQP